MRSPYERSDRFHPPHDDLDQFQRDMDPVGERAAAELDRERRRRSRMTDPDVDRRADMELARTRKILEQSSPQPNTPPLTDWSGALVFKEPEA